MSRKRVEREYVCFGCGSVPVLMDAWPQKIASIERTNAAVRLAHDAMRRARQKAADHPETEHSLQSTALS